MEPDRKKTKACHHEDGKGAVVEELSKPVLRPLLPLCHFDFESGKDCLYVDKTNLLGDELDHRKSYIFAPGMRRCGKSVTVELLRAMVEGNTNILKETDICRTGEQKKTSWNLPTKGAYGIIQLDFSMIGLRQSRACLAKKALTLVT